MKKYIAEFIGTFGLAFIVLTMDDVGVSLGFGVAVAAVSLALLVYTLGPISGCHINPAVTLAQWSVKKISTKDAVLYILTQFLAALLAMSFAKWLVYVMPPVYQSRVQTPFEIQHFLAEALGTFFFAM